MINRHQIFAIMISALVATQMCFAFDTETHAAITRQAYRNFMTADKNQSLFVTFGMDRLSQKTPFNLYWLSDADSAFPYYYIDGTGASGTPPWKPEAFERCQMQEFLYEQIPSEFQIFDDTVSNLVVPVYSGPSPQFDNLLPIQNWIVRGAIREDDFSDSIKNYLLGSYNGMRCLAEYKSATRTDIDRSLNHFYDPYSDAPLLGGSKAIDWALGFVNSLASSPQVATNRSASSNFFTYEDARNTLWWALTCERSQQSSAQQPCQKSGPPSQLYNAAQRQTDAGDRMALWATMFRSMGDVLHLLEDMGQPQHSRNDIHGTFLASDGQKAFEDYTNDRVLGTNSGANSYVRGFFNQTPTTFSAPPLGSYPAPMFSTPVRFFTTRGDGGAQAVRAGLADYTNRGFFTAGTLPDATSEPLPPHPIDTSYGIVVTPCEGLSDADSRLQSVTCAHYTHVVPDVVAPDYSDELPAGFTQPPLISDSVFHQILTTVQVNAGQPSTIAQSAIGIAELDTMGNLGIPRAIAYATGMLNYFFRGTLQVTAPASGIYAIVNHGTPHQVDSNGIPYLTSNPTQVFGFTTVRLQVQNTTGPIFDTGSKANVVQKTGGDSAKMVAIARYHRNPCYQPDLSGEASKDWVGQIHQPNCPSLRTDYPEISVSADIPVSQGLLDGQSPIEQQFDFSNDPIPINATDLFIQVAYRGRLGDETDGIAVGMIDVSEPSYENNLAMTDIPLQYQEDGSTWKWDPWTSPPWSTWTLTTGQTVTHAPPTPSPDLAVTDIEICDGSWQIYHSAVGEQLPEDHVVRIAALRDFSIHKIHEQVTFQGQFSGASSIGSLDRNGGDVNQAQDEKGAGMITTYQSYGRGIVGVDTVDFLYTCANPNLNCLQMYVGTHPFGDPSPWYQPGHPTDVLPPITPPAGGFVSENIGQVILPITSGSNQTVACTIQGSYQPYAIRQQTHAQGTLRR